MADGVVNTEDYWNRGLKETLEKVLTAKAFTLDLPCGIGGRFGNYEETTLSQMAGRLKASAALAHPLLLEYEEKCSRMDAEDAMNEMLMREDAEEFGELYDQAKRDIDDGALATIDNVVLAIKTARQGFERNPRNALLLKLGETGIDIHLVGF